MKVLSAVHDMLARGERGTLRYLRRRLVSFGSAAAAVAVLSVFVFQGQQVEVASAQTPGFEISSTAPFLFGPKSITVSMGTTVRWTATGAAPHTVTSDGCGDSAAGACVFDSGVDNPLRGGTARSTYDFRFSQPGIYAFYCKIHGAPGGVAQAGTVVVEGANTVIQPAQPVSAAQLRPPVSVAVRSPREGQVISGESVTVDLGINGASLREPVNGATDRLFGHFNLLLDTTVELSNQIQAVPGVTRSNTNRVTLANVRPGAHTLTVVWTYDNNVPPQPPITQTVRFSTTAAAAPQAAAATQRPITPPSTGDGGISTPAIPSGALDPLVVLLVIGLGATSVFALSRKRL